MKRLLAMAVLVGGALVAPVNAASGTGVTPAPADVREGDIVAVPWSATAATPAVATTGTKDLLVMLLSWPGHPADSRNKQQAEDLYNVTVNDWYRTASYGLLSITATSTGWLQIATPPDTDPRQRCSNLWFIAGQGDQAATAAGYDLTRYTNLVYYTPSCGFDGGWGTVGTSPGRVWLTGESELSTIVTTVHEMGHNLGLAHAGKATCSYGGSTVPYSLDCSMAEYGGPVSRVGGVGGMFSAPQLAYLGWLGSPGHRIVEITGSGTYTLQPLESEAGGVQALTLFEHLATFYLEYRQPLGVDATWPIPPGLTNGVLVHTPRGPYGGSTNYDMTPDTPGVFTDAALPVGRSWTNPYSGNSIRVVSANADRATIEVTMPTARVAPRIPVGPVVPQLDGTIGAVPEDGSAHAHGIAWTVKPGTAAIERNRLQFNYVRRDGYTIGWMETYAPPAGAPTTVDTWLDAGWTYRFRAKALAFDGLQSTWRTGPTYTYRLWQEKNRAIGYHGSWKALPCAECSFGNAMSTTEYGATATFRVAKAYCAAVVVTWGPTQGKVKITVDGRNDWFKTNYADVRHRTITYELNWATAGSHTITLTNVGPRMELDAVALLTAP